jgi:hypothetical protein
VIYLTKFFIESPNLLSSLVLGVLAIRVSNEVGYHQKDEDCKEHKSGQGIDLGRYVLLNHGENMERKGLKTHDRKVTDNEVVKGKCKCHNESRENTGNHTGKLYLEEGLSGSATEVESRFGQ